jgi:hypothetical protein
VTRRVCEKNDQNVAQPIFVQINKPIFKKKVAFGLFLNLNNHPLREISLDQSGHPVWESDF